MKPSFSPSCDRSCMKMADFFASQRYSLGNFANSQINIIWLSIQLWQILICSPLTNHNIYFAQPCSIIVIIFYWDWHGHRSDRKLKQVLKLMNNSCSQKPIEDVHLGMMDEPWYLIKHHIKRYHQVFIWDETRFLPEIKHLHFNEMFYWLTQLIWKKCNYIPEKTCHCVISYCFI